jgi:hypothetical protein
MLARAIALITGLGALTITGCVNTKMHDLQLHVKPTDKSVAFNIFTEHDFSDARWSDSKVQVRLAISRIRQNPYEEKIEYDSTFAWMDFKDVPEAMRKIQIEKKVSKVNEHTESISISYAYTTSIDGYLVSTGENAFINKWESKKEINIQL